MIIQAAVTQNEFLKNKKDDLQYLTSLLAKAVYYGFEIFITNYPITKCFLFTRIIELELIWLNDEQTSE